MDNSNFSEQIPMQRTEKAKVVYLKMVEKGLPQTV